MENETVEQVERVERETIKMEEKSKLEGPGGSRSAKSLELLYL